MAAVWASLHGLRLVLVLRHRPRPPFPHSLHLPAKNVIDNYETRLGLTRVPAHVVGLGILRQHTNFDDAEKLKGRRLGKAIGKVVNRHVFAFDVPSRILY